MSEGGGASRSTDPASGTSAATDVSLREHLTSLIDAVEKRSDARFEAMKELIDATFASTEKAIEKATVATEKRLEGFPQQFADRVQLALLSDKLQVGIDRNREDLDALAKRLDLREGEATGSRLTMGNLIALVTVGIAILGSVIVLANYLSAP